jgi:endonuclease/exonuclease/phosphatase family metal-dependent hydrolase
MRAAPRLVHAALLALSIVAAGCEQGGVDDDDDDGVEDSDQTDGGSGGSDEGEDAGGSAGDDDDSDSDGDDGPDGDVVDGIGSEDAIDIAAWNIENFPAEGQTPALVADLIVSLGLDLVAVEEIADEEAFDELLDRLPDHDGLLSFHEYAPGEFQKVGFIYRSDLMEVDPQSLLFEDDNFQFPRPPFQVRVTVPGAAAGPVEFVAIVLHLKAGTDPEDRERRRGAMVTLEQHVRGLVADGAEDVIVLGDYNEVLTSDIGRGVFGPFLDAPDLYTVETDVLAQDGEISFVPSGVMLDHIVTTRGMDDELGDSQAVIPRLDREVPGYVDRVSDHLPVAISLPIL